LQGTPALLGRRESEERRGEPVFDISPPCGV